MSRFDCQEFLVRLARLDHPEMISFAEEEAASVRRISSGVAGAVQTRKEGSAQYLNFIGGVLYYLRFGQRPAGLSAREISMIRPLIESLAAKGQSKAEALKNFTDEPA